MYARRLLSRIRDLVLLERDLYASDFLTFRQKCVYSFSRIFCLPFGYVIWFSRKFRSDSRLSLLLLPSYLSEMKAMFDTIELSNKMNGNNSALSLENLSNPGSVPSRNNSKDKSTEYLGSETTNGPRALAVVDIGANVGQWGITLANIVKSNILCFEPNQEIFQILQDNAKSLGSSIVHPLNTAIGPFKEGKRFYYIDKKSGQGSLFKENTRKGLLQRKEPREIVVQQQPLDSNLVSKFFPDDHEIDILKIDVEGYELMVLAGIIEMKVRYIWIEIDESREGGSKLDDILAMIVSSGICVSPHVVSRESDKLGTRMILIKCI